MAESRWPKIQFLPLTPYPPPTTEEDRLSWLRLLRPHRVGISTFFRLMHQHGSAVATLQALPDIARKAGLENYVACSVDRVAPRLRPVRRHALA